MSDKSFRTAVVGLLVLHLIFSFAIFNKLNSGWINADTGLSVCGSEGYPCNVRVINLNR